MALKRKKTPGGTDKTEKNEHLGSPQPLGTVIGTGIGTVIGTVIDDIEVLPPEDLVQVTDNDLTLLEPEAAEPTPIKKDAVKDIIPYDGLAAYLREISQYTPLSKEDERDLALKFFHEQDKEAAFQLVTRNLILVVKIAREYEKAARSLLDLIQEGNIGLMEAVKNFDPYRNVRFPSYAIWWIKAYIIRYIMANWRLVRIGTTQAQRKLFFNLKKEKDRLEQEGFYPGPKLLAERLEVKESDIVEMEQRLAGSDLSIDAPMQADSDSTLMSLLPAQGLNAEQLIATKELREAFLEGIKEFADSLNARERDIFEARILAEEKSTLQELSDKLKISKERVRQLENRTRDNLVRFLKSKLGGDVAQDLRKLNEQ